LHPEKVPAQATVAGLEVVPVAILLEGRCWLRDHGRLVVPETASKTNGDCHGDSESHKDAHCVSLISGQFLSPNASSLDQLHRIPNKLVLLPRSHSPYGILEALRTVRNKGALSDQPTNLAYQS
jgi:hypothetical protein